uniref:U-actitoxin-Aeq6b n=1 Tax=Actinia equina TaxID=6106 RepID=ACR2A_ACTEQ|nr:RecName: Full=U-actitoxin-Aeq6b; Short=U-AITX-Aeq6b; AltName: Full=Acrorhagin IIa; AltName: Full=Acrorhagin-2a; Flags: Precursor [Actinia equina]BAE46984.1 acrorhagin IIa [Actinia equina]
MIYKAVFVCLVLVLLGDVFCSPRNSGGGTLNDNPFEKRTDCRFVGAKCTKANNPCVGKVCNGYQLYCPVDDDHCIMKLTFIPG